MSTNTTKQNKKQQKKRIKNAKKRNSKELLNYLNTNIGIKEYFSTHTWLLEREREREGARLCVYLYVCVKH